MIVGIALQIMYMGNVTPGGAVAWDLSYATYIGTAGALVFGKGMGSTELIGLAVVFAGIGGLVGQLMWNVSYALNLPLNRLAQKYAEEGAVDKMHIPNLVGGQIIGFLCRAIPAIIVLTSMTITSQQTDFASIIPGWVTQALSMFGGMMAALGMGIILSFLWKKKYQIVIFLAGFILVTYFALSTMGVAVVSVIMGVLYYIAITKERKEADYE
jgi:PTS system mannose-specific IIC component